MSLASINVRFSADLKQFSREMQNSAREMEKFGAKLQSIGASMSTNITAPILALAAGSVFAYAKLETLEKGLISVMGSAEAAAKEFELLKEVAKLPGLGLEEAVRGSVNLQAAGFSAESARKVLLSFGNALATVGKGARELDLVTLALTQLNNKSGGFGQDLRQLTEQLPQLRGALKAAFGTSDTEVISRLGVTGTEVVERLTAEFAKLPKVTGGINNAFENLRDNTQISFARIGEAISSALNLEEVFDSFGEFIDGITQSFANLDPEIQKSIIVFTGIAAAIGPLILGIGTVISLLPTLIAGFAALTGPIGLTVLALAAVAAVVVTQWEPIKKILVDIANYFIDLYNSSTVFRAGVEYIILVFKNLWTNAKFVFNAIVSTAKFVVSQIFTYFSTLGKLVKGVLTFDGAAIKKALTEGFSGGAENTVKFFKNIKKDAVTAGTEVGQNINTAINNAFSKGNVSRVTIEKKKVDASGVSDAVEEGVVAGVTKGVEKVKKNKNLDELKSDLKQGSSQGTISAYDAEIAKLRQFRDEVAVTAQQVQSANDAIKNLEFGKSLKFDPASIIKATETTEQMMARLSAAVGGARAVLDMEQNAMVANADTFNEQFAGVWQNTISGFAASFGELVGSFAEGGLSLSSVGSLFLTTLADMAIQVGKIAITTGLAIAGIKKALQSLNPVVAIAAGVALVAVGTLAKSSLSNAASGNIPKFEDGGVVGGSSFYGDKILARVNSGELILNRQQQASLNGQLNAPGGSSVFIPDVRLKGNDIWVSFKRTEEIKKRVG